MQSVTLADVDGIELEVLLTAIHLRYGYDLRAYARPYVRRRLSRVMTQMGLSTLGHLQHQVLRDPGVFSAVLEALTIHVSELFRDAHVFRAYRELVLPHLRPYAQIKIWHAGCARGEEVYSNAIVLEEGGLLERTQIYATDLSADALARARDGVFAAADLAAYERAYEKAGGVAGLRRHVTEGYGHLAFNESLKRSSCFFEHNLISDHVFGEMQVVFCRNVLIYFESHVRDEVLHKLRLALCHGGFLILGSSERLTSLKDTGVEEFAPGLGIYRMWGGA